MLIDTVNTQSVEHIERAHPLGVTLGQVVVHGHHMHTVTSERIQEHGQGSHKGLTFTRCHLGDLSLMEHLATEELNVVVDHLPLQVVSSCGPVVMVDSLVTVNSDEVLGRIASQFTVEIRGGNDGLLVLCKTTSRFLHDTEGYRHYLVKRLLIDLQGLFVELVYFVEDYLTLINRRVFNLRFQCIDLFLLLFGSILYILLNLLGLGTELIVAQCLYLRISCLHLLYEWLNQLHVTC